MSDDLDVRERQLLAQLDVLKREYDRAAAPIIKELVKIRSMRPVVTEFALISPEQWEALAKITRKIQ